MKKKSKILFQQYSNLQWRLNKQAVATCTSSTGAVSWWWLVLARFGSMYIFLLNRIIKSLFVFNFQSTLLRVKDGETLMRWVDGWALSMRVVAFSLPHAFSVL
ncbi:hypothetical protein T4E_6514 [Trichinella pseudospiralis]|uniref:Uncharacterized protein n=1 Tax=Trichinella pseudospiralis TaxID=6337 RepID=A0A0V0XZ96_TRIPS|nr:hypothetical protein T4E_6514 [Trichinella pseudospiralis]